MKKALVFILVIMFVLSALILPVSSTSVNGSNYKGTQDGNTFTISWERYASAIEYQISCYNEDAPEEIYNVYTKDTEYKFENLAFGCTYSISVDAIYVSWTTEVFSGLEIYMQKVKPVIEYNGNGNVRIRKYKGMEYSFEGGVFSETNEFSGLLDGTYRIVQRDRRGTVSEALDFRVINASDPYIDTTETKITPPVTEPEPRQTDIPYIPETTIFIPSETVVDPIEEIETLPPNTSTIVYGHGVMVTHQQGNFNQNYKVSIKDVSAELYENDRSTFNGYVKKIKKAMGDKYGNLLAIYEVDFGVMENGNFVKREMLTGSVLSIDLKPFDLSLAYMSAIYPDKAVACVTSCKENNIRTAVTFEPDYTYIAIIGDKEAIKTSSFVPAYMSGSGNSGSSPISIDLGVSPVIIITSAVVVVLVVGAIFFTTAFVRRVKRAKSKEWLNDNR